MDEQKRMKERRKNLQADIANADRKHKNLQAEVTQLGKDASSRKARMDEARASQLQGRSNNQVLDNLTRLSEAGRVSGFHVRLCLRAPAHCTRADNL